MVHICAAWTGKKKYALKIILAHLNIADFHPQTKTLHHILNTCSIVYPPPSPLCWCLYDCMAPICCWPFEAKQWSLWRRREVGGEGGQMGTQCTSSSQHKSSWALGRTVGGGTGGQAEGATHSPPATCEPRNRPGLMCWEQKTVQKEKKITLRVMKFCGGEIIEGDRLSLAHSEKPLNLTKRVKRQSIRRSVSAHVCDLFIVRSMKPQTCLCVNRTWSD